MLRETATLEFHEIFPRQYSATLLWRTAIDVTVYNLSKPFKEEENVEKWMKVKADESVLPSYLFLGWISQIECNKDVLEYGL